MDRINLGDKAQDSVSGHVGIVTGRVIFLNGGIQYLIEPKVGADGKGGGGLWFDEQRVELVEE